MFEMWDHLVFGISAFIGNPTNVAFSLLSLMLALLIIYKLRDSSLGFRPRLLLIYSHLSLISFPAILLASSLSCISVGLGCPVTIARYGLLLLPISILLSLAIGSLLLPQFFMLGTRRTGQFDAFLRTEARKLGIRTPSIRILDSQKPIAFSISGLSAAIFVSVGMIETFTRKELEAVLLHELNHVGRRAPLLKTTSSILLLFSPIARLAAAANSNSEEDFADRYAIRRQSTQRHIRNAKQKAHEFD